MFIRGYSLHFFFVPEPVRRSFCEGGWLCGYEVIMQNKPNFRSNKRNTTFLLTKDYEQITMNNEPIKTNPIKPNCKPTAPFSNFPSKILFFSLFSSVFCRPSSVVYRPSSLVLLPSSVLCLLPSILCLPSSPSLCFVDKVNPAQQDQNSADFPHNCRAF